MYALIATGYIVSLCGMRVLLRGCDRPGPGGYGEGDIGDEPLETGDEKNAKVKRLRGGVV